MGSFIWRYGLRHGPVRPCAISDGVCFGRRAAHDEEAADHEYRFLEEGGKPESDDGLTAGNVGKSRLSTALPVRLRAP